MAPPQEKTLSLRIAPCNAVFRCGLFWSCAPSLTTRCSYQLKELNCLLSGALISTISGWASSLSLSIVICGPPLAPAPIGEKSPPVVYSVRGSVPLGRVVGFIGTGEQDTAFLSGLPGGLGFVAARVWEVVPPDDLASQLVVGKMLTINTIVKYGYTFFKTVCISGS